MMNHNVLCFDLILSPPFPRTASPADRSSPRGCRQWEGLEALEGMAAGLYSETFNAVVTLINR